MSAVTLKTLRADFEAARTQLLGEPFEQAEVISPLAKHRLSVDGAASYFMPGEFDMFSLERRIVANRVGETARLYVIARDHGLEAAMLFKLSDGAIDPRKAGAQ